MTKNTSKKKSSAAKKLVPAAGMLAISSMMLASSTYAWFTMNKTVTVTGMEVRTKVGSNLLIAPDKNSTADQNKDENYTTSISQQYMCLLEPVSTVDGHNYWYTVEASADGQKLADKTYLKYGEAATPAIANATANKTTYDLQFNQKYTTVPEGGFTAANIAMTTEGSAVDGAAYGYIDYEFYIKATSDANGQKVVMTDCNLLHNGAALGMDDKSPSAAISDKAWRVAVFSDTTSVNTERDTSASDTLVTILAPNGAANFSDETSGGTTTHKAVSGTDSPTIAAASTYGTKAVIGTITNAGDTAYYKVVVRLYLEGEDTTCTSETYAKLTSDYTLNLEFKLENNDSNAVQEIKSVVPSNG